MTNEVTQKTVLDRGCGGCTLCCKVMEVPEIDKPAGAWCPSCKVGEGCGIYATRPGNCRTFACGFLHDPGLDERWRPSNARFLLVILAPEVRVTAYVDSQRPDAWRREPYLSTLRRWSRTAIAHHGLIDIFIAGRSIIVLPDREVDIGTVQPDEKAMAYVQHTPQGPRYDAKKVKGRDAGANQVFPTAVTRFAP